MMDQSKQIIGKTVVVFGSVCLIAVIVIAGIFLIQGDDAAMNSPGTVMAATPDFDHEGAKAFNSLQKLNDAYLAGSSSERTLAEFYSLRQYPGSPPVIPHPIKTKFGDDQACLSCHQKGGYVMEWQRHAPITPHPENTLCQQCHIKSITDNNFVDSNWVSVPQPRLGNSYLPGAPPAFPHLLQMRENCVACHVGPGAVTEIRSDHAIRGPCRQCHMPLAVAEPFKREP